MDCAWSEILQGTKGAEVQIVALTGWGQEEDRRRAAAAGFDDHLTKPVDFDRLGVIAARSRIAPGADFLGAVNERAPCSKYFNRRRPDGRHRFINDISR